MWRFNELSYIWLHNGTNRTNTRLRWFTATTARPWISNKQEMYNLVYEIATVIRPLYPRYILWVFYVVQTGKHWVIPMTGSFYMMSFCPCIYLSFVKLSGKNIVTVWFFCHHCLFRKASHLWQEMAKTKLIYYTQENTI